MLNNREVAFVIFKSDDNGQPYGEPLDMVYIEETDDWLKDKQDAIDKFVLLHPDQTGNMGWLSSSLMIKSDVETNVHDAQCKLNTWTRILNKMRD